MHGQDTEQQNNNRTLRQDEKDDIEWWCLRHKLNCQTLVIRLLEILNGTPEHQEDIKSIMSNSILDYAKVCDADLDRHYERMKDMRWLDEVGDVCPKCGQNMTHRYPSDGCCRAVVMR